MNHLKDIEKYSKLLSDDFFTKASGCYYTHENVCKNLCEQLKANIDILNNETFSIIDPFCGDGRLLINFIQLFPKTQKWKVDLWDINLSGLEFASEEMERLKSNGYSIDYIIFHGDSFKKAITQDCKFDVVITNPPWENIKPDVREIKNLPEHAKESYKLELKKLDTFMEFHFPSSQPLKKFAGWGTNLSRVGMDVCNGLAKSKGLIGIVMPSSIIADSQSINLRKKILLDFDILNINYYPAEAKLFGKADATSITIVYRNIPSHKVTPSITRYDKDLKVIEKQTVEIDRNFLKENSYIIPISHGIKTIEIFYKLISNSKTWGDYEASIDNQLWAGREVDETRIGNFLSEDINNLSLPFYKGRMIGRYSLKEEPSLNYSKVGWVPPSSSKFLRIAWRDISRPSQKRRVMATLISPNSISGNSLGVAYFKNGDEKLLKVLLAILNSFCFEFQLRNFLSTGHVSLSAIRKIGLPPIDKLLAYSFLSELVDQVIQNDDTQVPVIESYVACKLYNLSRAEYLLIIESFNKVTAEEKVAYIRAFDEINTTQLSLSV